MYLKILREQRKGKEVPEGEKLEMADWISALNNLDNYIEAHRVGEIEGTRLRERQIDVFDAMRNFLEEGGKDGYIKFPTGTGKTVIFLKFLEALRLRTLIVVPTNQLVEQTEEKINLHTQGLGVGKTNQFFKEQGKDATIITYNSLIIGLKNGTIKPEDYKCLILDEAHRGLAEGASGAIKQSCH